MIRFGKTDVNKTQLFLKILTFIFTELNAREMNRNNTTFLPLTMYYSFKFVCNFIIMKTKHKSEDNSLF